jgi:hypothetical protein
VLLGTVEMQLLSDKIRARLLEDLPEVADQVSYDAMLFTTAAEANVFLVRLESGETWEDLVEEIKAMTAEEKPSAYSVPWATQEEVTDSMGEEIASLLFSLEVGVPSGVTATQDGRFGLFSVTGHEERELSSNYLRTKESELYTAWLEGLRAAAEIEKIDGWESRVPQVPALGLQYFVPTATPPAE